MKVVRYVLVAVGLFAANPLLAEPIDLTSAYQKALEYDARLRVAKAENLIYKEEIGKAKSQLLPNVYLNAGRGRNATQHGYMGRFYPIDYYDTVNFGFSVRQTLFNFSSLSSYKQAKLVSAKSDIDLQKEEGEVMIRITEAYCNALYAEDNLKFSNVLIKATQEQLRQAKQRFKKGFGTIIEIEEAQAACDNAEADGVEIANSVEFSRCELEDLTGSYPEELCAIAPEKLRLARPEQDVDWWIERARSSSYVVAAARQEILIAKKDIDKQRATRYPTIDLVGGRNYSESENNYSIGSIYNTYSIAIQLSMPTYTGGYTGAAIRQAKAKWSKAGEQLTLQEREVESEVRKYYNGVVSTLSLIKAYEQSVKSREIALIGTKKGYQAGLRSNVEVLDAEQKLFASKRNLAKSRYQYLINELMLKKTAGILSIADITEVNSWLAGTPQEKSQP